MDNTAVHVKSEEIEKEVERITLNAKEAAKYLGVCYDTLLSAVRKKSIPCFQIGRQYFFKKDTLDKWMSRLEELSITSELPDKNRIGKIRRLK